MNTNLIIKSLNLFDKVRFDNEKVYNNFFSRLYGMNIKYEFNIHSKNEKSDQIKTTINFAINLNLGRIKLYENQRKRLKNTKINSPLIFGLASNRLKLEKNCIVESLKKALKTLGSKDNINLPIKLLQEKDTLYIFDGAVDSDIWEKLERENHNIFIFDVGFILYIFLIGCVQSLFFFRNNLLFNFIKFYYTYLTSKYFIKKHNVLIRAILLVTINNIIKDKNNINSVLLSSNANLLEILRILLLQGDNSDEIIEILHGIPMLPTLDYFRRLESIQYKQNLVNQSKQKFIMPIEGLKIVEPALMNMSIPNQGPINPYLTKTLYRLIKQYNDYDSFLFDTMKVIDNNLKKDFQVLTFFGGTNLEGDFYQSQSYRLELFIINFIDKRIKQKNLNTLITYVPHPSNYKYSQLGLKNLKNFDIYLIDESIKAYLIADKCISLVSSCLFEMIWFGGSSFTPMIPEDKMFSKEFLDMINHPGKNGIDNLYSSLNRFIDIRNVTGSFEDKITSRVAKILGKQYMYNMKPKI